MPNQDVAEGGCICGRLRYRASAEPLRVTFCHCRFCQRATGGAYMVEPIFDLGAFEVMHGAPATYQHRSEGSGKMVTIHFCANCGTKLFLTFERFPGVAGVYGGTFDDPDWFAREPEGAKHIFLDVAQHGVVVPAGYPVFGQHASNADGSTNEAQVFDDHRLVRRR